MKEVILKIINEKPKHFSKIIKNNDQLNQWVINNTLVTSTNYSEMIYSAINQIGNICENHNQRIFKNIFDGYAGCGRANDCACTRIQVSKSVKNVKKQVSVEEQLKINDKRKQTNLKKYGVENAGQLAHAKQQHKQFYSDPAKIKEVVERVEKTKLKRHNNKNYNNRQQAIYTNFLKYGIDNTWKLSEAQSNPKLKYLDDKQQLEQLYNTMSIQQISEFCDVHVNTVYRKLFQAGLRDRYKSVYEQEIINFIKTIIPNAVIVTNTRSIISKEIDIYLPEYRLAIEYNSIWWHHDQIPYITKDYHYQKFIECEQQGIRLLTIFSNSWEDKKEAWKHKIISMIKQTPDTVYARKCKIKTISSKDTKEILNQYHIQGYSTAQICYGLEFNGKIVAAMTFSKQRNGIGKNRGNNAYELVRYVTSCSVVGGASKLLTAFEKTHKPNLLVSYSDNRYSSGGLYNILGFVQESENKFNYWYYDPTKKQAYHRYKFAKHQLVKAGYDATKTETQITNEMGLLRIWDCGSRTWIKHY